MSVPPKKRATKAHRPSPATRRVYGGVAATERIDARRERLLEAALECFATRGFQSTPIETLCAEARVTTRHFYETFAGREALLLALYERIIGDTQAAVREALSRPGLGHEARLGEAIRAFVGAYVSDRRRARVGVLEVVGVSPAFEERRRCVIREFAQVLEDYAGVLAAEGVIARRDHRPICIALVGGINELLAEWLIAGDSAELAQLEEHIGAVTQALLLGGARIP